MQEVDAEGFAALPENFRQEWDSSHPLGWLEHRQAWNPAWNPDARVGEWVLSRKVVIQVNDLLFLHGGISASYCQNSLQSMTEMVVRELRNNDPVNPGILMDEYGPLWYRGHSGELPAASPDTVQAILDHHGARHIVVGHTPTGGVIWPRYGGSVIQIDTGIASAYGGHIGFLEVTSEGLFAGYPQGKIKLPGDESELLPYLEQVMAFEPNNVSLQKLHESLATPEPVSTEVETAATEQKPEEGGSEGSTGDTGAVLVQTEPVPICGISL